MPKSNLPGTPVKEKRLSIKEESQPYYDPNNLENCVLFLDAKRKLRLVLSNCDCDIGQNVLNFGFSYVPSSPKDVNIVVFLSLDVGLTNRLSFLRQNWQLHWQVLVYNFPKYHPRFLQCNKI
jgi:hypothetical protein